MFVRKKKNKSGLISVQVIDKSSGQYKLAKTIGSSYDPTIIEELVKRGKQWIDKKSGQQSFDFSNERKQVQNLLDNIEGIRVIGIEYLLGKLFDQIGFNQIQDPLFRKLVLARLSFPASKLKTTDYLSKYHYFNIDVQSVYRYLDKLYNTQKEIVQQISYAHTLKILNGVLQVVFYDVTTVYFEIDQEDDIRKTGFSKEGKHQHPQIVLGLLVGPEGYPLAYEIFEGNKFEGHTMIPVIDRFRSKYDLEKLVIIADSGLLSKDNIQQLRDKDYEFILGARIKKEAKGIKRQILALELKNGQSAVIDKTDNLKLVINYSDKRARKDLLNRQRGLNKLEKKLRAGKLTKAHINNRGYNKYLQLDGQIQISIDKDKFEADAAWDGLKGYLTNTSLNKEQIIENYKHLWQIEKAFRVAKTDLKLRPIYHRAKRRIEAHICLNFVAYKIYKELERQLKIKNSALSPEKAIDIAKTIQEIIVLTPNTQVKLTKVLYLNQEQKNLAELFDFH